MRRTPRRIPPADRLKAFLVHPRLPLVAALLGMALGIPTLWMGWGPSDDLLQRSAILSNPLSALVHRLYVFLDPAINTGMMERGIFPWWTYEEARIIFFRPLSVISLWLDYQFWPDSNPLMRLHSLLLYGVLCLAAVHLYRRLMGVTPSSGLAAILFALSAAHIGCVVSLAARNLLLTTLFGVLAVTFHDRWRRDGWRPAPYLAAASLALGLLSAETGAAAGAYLLAYIVFLEKGPWRRRIFSFLPYLAVAGAWLALYQLAGFGALGSGFYLSPWQEPLTFLLAVVERAPFLLMGQWILPDPVVYTVLSTGAKTILWSISVGVLVFIGALLKPLFQADPAARFWAAGMLLAVIPVCAVSPASGRHLTFISLGAFGLMGQLIAGRLQRAAWAPPGRTWRAAALVMSSLLLALHLLVYPVAGSFTRPTLDTFAGTLIDIGRQPGMEQQDYIIVNAPSPGLFLYLPSYREYSRQPFPAHLRILAPGFSAITLTVVDEHTLLVRPENGFLLSPEALALDGKVFFPIFHPSYSFQYGDSLFRGRGYPMALGEEVELAGMTVEVVAMTGDGRPLEARMAFDLPLADPALVWLVWDWEHSRYLPLQPPAVGETITIPGPY